MKKFKLFVLPILSIFTLFGCQQDRNSILESTSTADSSITSSSSSTSSKESESSQNFDQQGFTDAFNKLKTENIIFKGQTQQILYKSTSDNSVLEPEGDPYEGNVEVTFNTSAFHYFSTGFDNDDFYVYKNKDDKPVSKYINRDNEVKETTSNVATSWKFYANPFVNIDASLFTYTQEYEGFELYSFADANLDYETSSLLADPITQMTFSAFKGIYFLYDSSTKNIKSYGITTDVIYLQNEFRQFKYLLDIEVDNVTTIKDVEVYKDVDFKDTLLNSFNKLEKGTPYIITETVKKDEKSETRFAAISDTYLFTANSLSVGAYPDTNSVEGYIEIEDQENGPLVHKLMKNSKGEYGYRTDPYIDEEKGALTDVKYFQPYRNIAIEAFSKVDDLTYTLENDNASNFARYFNAFNDQTLFVNTTKVEVKLDETKGFITSITYTLKDRVITDTYDYKSTLNSSFGIDINSLKPMLDMEIFEGTYKGSRVVNDETIEYTVVFSKDKVTLNGTELTPLTFSDSYNEIKIQWASSDYKEGYTFILNADKSVQMMYFSVTSTNNFNITLEKIS